MMMMSLPKNEPFYAEATTTAAPTISESTWKELNNIIVTANGARRHQLYVGRWNDTT